MMNDRIRQEFTIKNPFDFNHVSYLTKMDDFDDIGPSGSTVFFQTGFTTLSSDDCVAGYVAKWDLARNI